MKDTLRPCPFCGSTALIFDIVKTPSFLGELHSFVIIHDPKHNCSGCTCAMYGTKREELAEKWNSRASNMPKMENPPEPPTRSNPEAARLEELLQAEQLTKAEAEELAGYGWRTSIGANRYHIYKVDRHLLCEVAVWNTAASI